MTALRGSCLCGRVRFKLDVLAGDTRRVLRRVIGDRRNCRIARVAEGSKIAKSA
jgi:hypothetical protein